MFRITKERVMVYYRLMDRVKLKMLEWLKIFYILIIIVLIILVLVRNFFRNINIHSYISLNDKNFISFHFIFLLMIVMLNLLVNYKR